MSDNADVELPWSQVSRNYFIFSCGFRSMTSTLSVELNEVKWCLKDALAIQNELAEQRCPYDKIQRGVNCTMHCKGTFIANNSLYDEEKIRVNFTLNLPTLTNLHENMPRTFHKKYCNIPKCIFDRFSVTCVFPKQTDNGSKIGSANINMNSETKEYEQKYLLVAFACVVAGCIIGVLLTVTGRCFKVKFFTNHRRASSSSANQDQPVQKTGESIDILYMYSDIEDIARQISEKGVQVPSLKDKSPSSRRSETSNVYHLLNEKGSPVDSLTLTMGTTSRRESTSEDYFQNKSLRRNNSSTETMTMEQTFETDNKNRNCFQLEKKLEDSNDT